MSRAVGWAPPTIFPHAIGWAMLTLLLLIAPLGCISTNVGTSRDSLRTAQPSVPPSVDTSRAYLPLSQIEPRPSKPSAPKSIQPLSERAFQQIAKARKLIDEQRYTEAAIELERALRYDPNHPDIHRTLAMLHWEAGNLQRARTHATRALEVNPDDAPSNYILGRYHAQAGDNASAMAAFRTALLCSNFARDLEIAALCHYHLAEALVGEGYLQAALEQYAAFENKAASIDRAETQPELATLLDSKKRSVREARADIHETLGRYADAAFSLAPLVSGSPDNVALALRYARLLMRAGRFEDALAAARTILSDDDEVIEFLFEIHQAMGHTERILEDLRTRIAEQGDDPHLVLHLARMLMRLRLNDAAREELERYLAKDADADGVRAALVDLLIDHAAWTEALWVCAEGVERSPDRTTGLAAKIVALAPNEDAVDQLLKPPAGEEPPAGLYLRGMLAVELDRLADAETWFRQVYAQRPAFVEARVALARLYLRTYRYDEAIQVAARADDDTPEDARLELVLGEVYERLDHTKRAELHFKAAIQRNRTDPRPMLALAELYRQSGQRLRTQRQLRALLEIDPNHEAARERLAFSYLRDGKRDEAVSQLEELKRRAVNPTTKARCTVLLDQVYKPESPRQDHRRALIQAMEEYGQDAATWLAVASSYGRGRDADEKRKAYGKALAIDPDNEDAAIGLVETSIQLLAFEEAAEQLARLLKRRPNHHAWRLGLRDRQLGLINLYWIIQDYDAALAVLETMESREPMDENWRRRYRLATVETLRLADRTEEVIAQLNIWAQAGPDHQLFSSLLAKEYLRQDQASRAVPLLEAIYVSSPDDRNILSSLTTALVRTGQPDRASQYVLDWLRDDPENDNAVWALARLMSETGRIQDGLELVRNQLLHTFNRERFQDITIALLTQAKAYDECLDLIDALIDQVLTLLRSVRDQHARAAIDPLTERLVPYLPNEPYRAQQLHTRLAKLRQFLVAVLFAARDYPAAKDRLTSWLEAARSPAERLEYLRRLAFCYRAQGHESEANEVIGRALLLDPTDVTLNNDVAYGWINQGVRLDEAERMIRHALWRVPRQAAYLDTYGWLLYKKSAFEEAKKWLTRAHRARSGDDPVIRSHLGDVCWRLGLSNKAIEHWEAALVRLRRMRETNEDRQGVPLSGDERRVRDTTQQKIDDARAGIPPAVAPLAAMNNSE